MRTWASTSAKTVLLAAGFVALGSGAALAAGTSGDGSVLGGNQVVTDVAAPVNACGNAIGAVLGTAAAHCDSSGAAVVNGGGGSNGSTSGDGSVLGGNQVVTDVAAPVNASGNAIGAVLGIAGASATDAGGPVVGDEPGHENGAHGYRTHHAAAHQDGPATSGEGSVAGGNQVVTDVAAPVNASGNAVGAALGMAGASSSDSGAVVFDRHAGDGASTSGQGSVAGGNQVVTDVAAPVNASGNAVGALLGAAGASSTDSHSAVVRQSAPSGPATHTLSNELPAPAGHVQKMNRLPAPTAANIV